MTNENTCVLADGCKAAGTDACTRHCTHFIAMHGASGEGGRSGAAGLPREYRLVTLKNSPARADQSEVYKAAEAYAASFARQFEQSGPVAAADRIKDLYLFSESPGTPEETSRSSPSF